MFQHITVKLYFIYIKSNILVLEPGAETDNDSTLRGLKNIKYKFLKIEV